MTAILTKIFGRNAKPYEATIKLRTTLDNNDAIAVMAYRIGEDYPDFEQQFSIQPEHRSLELSFLVKRNDAMGAVYAAQRYGKKLCKDLPAYIEHVAAQLLDPSEVEDES